MLLLKIWQYSPYENTWDGSFFKESFRLQHRHFLVNIAKSLRTPILKIMRKRLLLPLEVFCIRNLSISAMRMLHLAY